ncbi:MAG: hypothetical protein IJV45_02140 [Prevotella sp.]|nr:hypothetical protein [Prevotella sp.]
MNKTKYDSPQTWEISLKTDRLMQTISVSSKSFENEEDFTFASRRNQRSVWDDDEEQDDED